MRNCGFGAVRLPEAASASCYTPQEYGMQAPYLSVNIYAGAHWAHLSC
jgi:hypothetical protein